MLNLLGTQYEEWKWLNLADKAKKGSCYIGNPEKFASVIGVPAINCYGVAAHAWECGGWCEGADFGKDEY